MGVTDAGLPALFEQLTDVFGVGSFAPGGGRFHTFLRDYRALLPTASAFADAWDELARQAFFGGGAGPLDVASGNAGAGRGAGAKLQRDMTAQLEQGRRDELHRDMIPAPLPPKLGALSSLYYPLSPRPPCSPVGGAPGSSQQPG